MSQPSGSKAARHSTTDSDSPSERKRARRSDDGPPEQNEVAGKIIKVEAKNFMCHENLKFADFNQRINFITGQNGSGKSAVLTAVMVCLGSRATVTDRGRVMSEMIRTGQNSATVAVKLSNRGQWAHRPDLYGDTITVERTIRKNSSSYRLLNDTGRKVSDKKRDLIDVLDSLNIQVDNPIAVLTQETSKNFLRSDDPGKKYALFMRATRLQHIDRNIEIGGRNTEAAARELHDKQETLSTVERSVGSLKHDVQLCENLQQYKQKVDKLKRQLPWAKVATQEKRLAAAQSEHTASRSRLQAAADSHQRCQSSLAADQQQRTELETKRTAIGREMEEMVQRTKNLDERRRLQRRERDDAAAILKTETEKKKSLVRERDDLAAEIERQRNEAQPDYAAEERAHQQKLEQLKLRQQETAATEQTRAAHLTHCSETLRQQSETVDRLVADETNRRNRIAELEAELSRKQSNQTDPRALFGGWVTAVDRAIETCWERKSFRRKPIGPIGAYIKLQAGCEQWTTLVETCLGDLLQAYLVDSRDDMHVMLEIIQQHTRREPRKPRVICSKFLNQRHDVSRHGIDTSGEHVSVWSVLDIEHPVVANAVVDQARVESVLLLATNADARNSMSYRNRVPRGCAQALTRVGSRFYPDPGYRVYPITVRHQPQYLQVSVQEVLREMERDLKQQRLDVQVVTDRLGCARATQRPSRQQEAEARRQLAAAKDELQRVSRQLQQLRDTELPQPINLRALEEELETCTELVVRCSESEAARAAEHQAAELKLSETCAELKTLKGDLHSQFTSKLEECEASLEALERKRPGLARSLLAATQKMETAKEQADRQAEAVAVCQQELDQALANTSGEKIAVRQSEQDIEKRLDTLEKTLRNQPPERLDLEQAKVAYQDAQLSYERTKNKIDSLQSELDMVDGMVKERRKRFVALQRSLAGRITSFFHSYLDARRFKGNMVFNHRDNKLAISVTPSSQQASASRAPAQLSGGERSFTTLAYVLAMWSAIYSPFRMLDEFDVFMDEANRRISHDMLVSDARSHNSQYFFISPLDIPHCRDDPDISVHRMAPPVRQSRN